MIEQMTVEQPVSGPAGEPYAVVCDSGTPVRLTWWFDDERAAWEFRDQLLEEGQTGVRVLGAPCRVTAVVPEPVGPTGWDHV